ncbi:uncharacterized protein LOC143844664 isoform X1 [Paroedura picta]|uniref:uncharacterized protein LOC143844664 isoform X1 n=1 Tax=Paroedura picta TaxID=143630 RepID=UPI00405788B8
MTGMAKKKARQRQKFGLKPVSPHYMPGAFREGVTTISEEDAIVCGPADASSEVMRLSTCWTLFMLSPLCLLPFPSGTASTISGKQKRTSQATCKKMQQNHEERADLRRKEMSLSGMKETTCIYLWIQPVCKLHNCLADWLALILRVV